MLVAAVCCLMSLWLNALLIAAKMPRCAHLEFVIYDSQSQQ